MPDKVELDDILASYGGTAKLNANFDEIQAAFQRVVFRDGTAPNFLTADLDLNGFDLNNIGPATTDQFRGLPGTVAVGTVTSVPTGDPLVITNVGTPGAAIFNFQIPVAAAGVVAETFATRAANRTDLAATLTTLRVVYLYEAGREGLFVWKIGNYSAQITADTLQGIYVGAVADPMGLTGAWVRSWDGVTGQPEWFGATVNSSGFDNRAAFTACVSLCPVMLLRSADYWIAGLWKFQTQYRKIKGSVIPDGYTTGNGTRVLSTSAAAGVIQIGPDVAPVSLSNYHRNMHITDVVFMHGVALTAPGVGLQANAVVTIRPQFLLNCLFERCAAWEPFVGIKPHGCVRTFIKDFKVLRTAALAGLGDFCRAIWVDGVPAVANGGNPSLYLVNNTLEASSGLGITKQLYFLDGEFADVFIDGGETSQSTNGIVIAGNGGNNYGRQNLHIHNFWADQCGGPAIDVTGLNSTATVTIEGGYFQSATASAILLLRGENGTVSVGGGAQIICGTAGTTIGIHANSQPGVSVDDTVQITDCPKPVVVEGLSPRCKINPTIKNPLIGDGTQAAVFVSSGNIVSVNPIVSGKANAFSQGVLLSGVANTKVQVDPSSIDLFAVSGGVNKVVINVTNITTPGYYNSTGVAAASGTNNFVTGLTQ